MVGLLYVLVFSVDSAIAALQVDMGHKLINNLRKDKGTEEGDDKYLLLPISDTTPPKQRYFKCLNHIYN